MSIALTSNASWASGEQITAAKLNLTSLPNIQVTPSADFFTSVSGINTYIGTLANLPNPIPDGLTVQLKIPAQTSVSPWYGSNTGPSTLYLNAATGVKDIVKPGNIPLANGDIRANSIVTVAYNITSDKWYLQTLNNPGMEHLMVTSVLDPGGTDGLHYKISIPYFPGALNGPSSPVAIATGQQVTFKAHIDSLAGSPNDVKLRIYTDLLSNATLAPQISIRQYGTTALGLGAIKANQIVVLQYDGSLWQMISPSSNTLTNNVVASSFTYTSGFFGTDYVAYGSAGATRNIAHGLSGMPTLFRAMYVCAVTDTSGAGYSVGDEIPLDSLRDSAATRFASSRLTVSVDSTNVTINVTESGLAWYLVRKSVATQSDISVSAPNFGTQWKLKLYVFKA